MKPQGGLQELPQPKRGLLERLLRRYAPGMALRREQERKLLDELEQHTARSYEAASHGRRTQGWRADGSDANAEVGEALDVLRSRHRQLVRDNPWASRAVRVITNHAIGTGIQTRSLAGARRGKRLNDLWREFSTSIESDQGGRRAVDAQVRLAFRSLVEGGDCLLRRLWTKDGPGGLPFRLQLLEGDHLATDYTRQLDDGAAIIQGVEFDKRGRRLAYHVHEAHPGSGYPTPRRNLLRLDARDVLHPYREDRIGQVRGIPWGASVMLRLRDWDLYEDAQLLRQRIAACYVAFEHDITGDPETSPAKSVPGLTKGGAPDGADTQHLEPGTWEKLSGGRTITFGTPPGVEGYRENFEISAMACAVGYGLTYAQLTGDLSRGNYSSMRSGHVEQRAEVDEWRWHLAIPHLCNPLWRWFIEGALVAGLIEPASDLYLADFTPPRQELQDPSVEIPAAIKGVRAGFSTWSEQLRSWGFDPDEVATELASDLQRFDRLGIAVDCDGRRPQQGGVVNPPPLPEPDPDAAARAHRELERLNSAR